MTVREKMVQTQAINIGEGSVRGDGRLSPLELIKLHGGKAHKVKGIAARGVDSMIAVYKDRFTYTFILNKEVASIHFDVARRKVFFSGHNIENMQLSSEQKRSLLRLVDILASDGEGQDLKEDYEATLHGLIADNK